jgi:hypothetical protein
MSYCTVLQLPGYRTIDEIGLSHVFSNEPRDPYPGLVRCCRRRSRHAGPWSWDGIFLFSEPKSVCAASRLSPCPVWALATFPLRGRTNNRPSAGRSDPARDGDCAANCVLHCHMGHCECTAGSHFPCPDPPSSAKFGASGSKFDVEIEIEGLAFSPCRILRGVGTPQTACGLPQRDREGEKVEGVERTREVGLGQSHNASAAKISFI